MRYLSGIQPTGRLHLGNYFGMIRPAVELQAKGEAYYFLADYHALTGASEPGQLEGLVKETFWCGSRKGGCFSTKCSS